MFHLKQTKNKQTKKQKSKKKTNKQKQKQKQKNILAFKISFRAVLYGKIKMPYFVYE